MRIIFEQYLELRGWTREGNIFTKQFMELDLIRIVTNQTGLVGEIPSEFDKEYCNPVGWSIVFEADWSQIAIRNEKLIIIQEFDL